MIRSLQEAYELRLLDAVEDILEIAGLRPEVAKRLEEFVKLKHGVHKVAKAAHRAKARHPKIRQLGPIKKKPKPTFKPGGEGRLSSAQQKQRQQAAEKSGAKRKGRKARPSSRLPA